MNIIPTHDLMIKDLQHAEFDIIPLNGLGERNYDGIIPHRHNFYELLVFTEGGGIHEVDFKNYNTKANSFHFVSPTQVHKLKANKSKGFVLCFTNELMYSLLGKNKSFIDNFPFYNFNTCVPFLQLDKKSFLDISQTITAIDSVFYSEHLFKQEIIRSYLHIVLLRIKEFFLQNKKVELSNEFSHNPRIISFLSLIDKNYSSQLSIKNYSEKLNVSPNYLNALCKKETGKTAIQLIHERILLEAKRLLYSTNLSSKEISFSLNFEDVSYFNRFFKRNMSLTPLEYRQQFNK